MTLRKGLAQHAPHQLQLQLLPQISKRVQPTGGRGAPAGCWPEPQADALILSRGGVHTSSPQTPTAPPPTRAGKAAARDRKPSGSCDSRPISPSHPPPLLSPSPMREPVARSARLASQARLLLQRHLVGPLRSTRRPPWLLCSVAWVTSPTQHCFLTVCPCSITSTQDTSAFGPSQC